MAQDHNRNKPKNLKAALLRLLKYIGQYKWRLILVLILAILSTSFMILGPKILGSAVDELFTGILKQIDGSGSIDYQTIAKILGVLGGLYILSSTFSYVQGYIMARVTTNVTYQLREDVNHKLHNLPLSYYDNTKLGDILSRITNDIDTITQTLNQSVTQVITAITTLVGITIIMFTISWQLALVTLLVLPISFLVVLMIMSRSQIHFKNQQDSLGLVNGHVEESLGNHTIIKTFNKEEDSIEEFDDYSEQVYEAAWRSNFLSSLIMPITTFIGNIAYVVICILGGYYTVRGTMTVGGIQAFIQYVRQFNQPIGQIASISNILQLTAAATERVFEIIDESEEVEDTPEALNVTLDKSQEDNTTKYVEGNVVFDHVSFGYAKNQTIINDFSVTVKEGQKVAIVGPTGAGKTTIIKLLMRFYDVDQGEIRIDNTDIKAFKRDELRKLFGIVLQDTWLFNGTVRENIRYGNLNSSDEAVKKAAIDAQIDHYIKTWPDGYDMVINEETSNVSTGQKQLLTIARAILSDPKILILDEATSNVDTRTEVLIQKAMDKLMEGRTSFVIAHRLSTIQNADLILVMKDGDIIEQGSHNELLQYNGFYKSLYDSQFDE